MNVRTTLAGLFFVGSLAASQHALANVYPTEVVADYVIGCMAANGSTQDTLRRCSCSIDTVASILSYDAYEKADTVIRMRGVGGANTEIFRTTTMLDKMVDQLRLAQIEADFRCF
jgi:succinate dehydrogenase/fumarate reductase flavoprotein subunit